MRTIKYILTVAAAVVLCSCTTSTASDDHAIRTMNSHGSPKLDTFEVFFDFDRANIGDAAAKTLQLAADSAKRGNVTGITLTVHIAAGPDIDNQSLSKRRADVVKAELVKDGVPEAEITTVGVGKAGQLVPTADGVREPQNRRTEIVLH
jgi:outer membrane protein OmpA-like peptidoglycan-associated protein